jgi:hypothetical protein|tara:strand:- start:11452 stop:12006 length:555 start_codon:yes stop_codon:yes gene_type:complete
MLPPAPTWPQAGYLDLQPDADDAMATIVGASSETSHRIYRLAFGPNAGRKALTLQALPTTDTKAPRSLASKQSGFSLHAGVSCKAAPRNKLERICRYITRPPIAERRLSIAGNGNIVYALKTLYDDGPMGTPSHISCLGGPASPLEFIGRLAALIPKPRVHDQSRQQVASNQRHACDVTAHTLV